MHDGSLAPPVTARFSRKRDAIVAAATELLNYRGVRGMTLALVAERVGLITTSVTYYFKKKDELAAACSNSTSPFAPVSPPARRRRFRCSATSGRCRL